MATKFISDTQEIRRATCNWCRRRRLCMIFTEADTLGATRVCKPCSQDANT